MSEPAHLEAPGAARVTLEAAESRAMRPGEPLLEGAGLKAPLAEGVDLEALTFPAQLLSIGNYADCALEYLRVGFEQPALHSRSAERAALCFQLGGNRVAAENVLHFELARHPPEPWRSKLVYRLCIGDVLAPPHLLSAICLSSLRPRSEEKAGDPVGDLWMARTAYLPAMSTGLIRLDFGSMERTLPTFAEDGMGEGRGAHAEGRGASRELTTLMGREDPVLLAWRREDAAFAARSRSLPTRKPWLAAILSAVVPGLGRGYVGRWGDMGFSLALVVTPGVVAGRAFSVNGSRSMLGWLALGSSALAYAGNVYGSAIGARTYNDAYQEALKGEMLQSYSSRLDP